MYSIYSHKATLETIAPTPEAYQQAVDFFPEWKTANE